VTDTTNFQQALAQNLSVLVLDDDQFTLELVSVMLNGLGITAVRKSSHARQALDIMEQQPPDILLSDINMPDMDGSSFCAILPTGNTRAALFSYPGWMPASCRRFKGWCPHKA